MTCPSEPKDLTSQQRRAESEHPQDVRVSRGPEGGSAEQPPVLGRGAGEAAAGRAQTGSTQRGCEELAAAPGQGQREAWAEKAVPTQVPGLWAAAGSRVSSENRPEGCGWGIGEDGAGRVPRACVLGRIGGNTKAGLEVRRSHGDCDEGAEAGWTRGRLLKSSNKAWRVWTW